jgi:1,4-alpha-glucan branching enzyme
MMTRKTIAKTVKTKIPATLRELPKRRAVNPKAPPPTVAKSMKAEAADIKVEKPRRKRVTFRFEGKPGVDVRLAGSFNGWDPSAHSLSPVKGNGTYVATLLLLPGSHEYKFVVDGQWVNDSRCTERVLNGHGTQNSVIEIR